MTAPQFHQFTIGMARVPDPQSLERQPAQGLTPRQCLAQPIGWCQPPYRSDSHRLRLRRGIGAEHPNRRPQANPDDRRLVTLFDEAVGDPLYVVMSNGAVGRKSGETYRVEALKGPAGLPKTDHPPGGLGIETPAAVQPTAPTNLREIRSDAGHGIS